MAYVFGAFALTDAIRPVIGSNADLAAFLGMAFENRNSYQFVTPSSASTANASLAFTSIQADATPALVGAIATGSVVPPGVPGSAKAWVDAAVAAGNVVLVNTLALKQGKVQLAVFPPDARARALTGFVPQTSDESLPPPRWAVLAASDAAVAKLGAADLVPVVPVGYTSRNPNGSCPPGSSATSVEVTLADGTRQTLPVCQPTPMPCGPNGCVSGPEKPSKDNVSPWVLGLGLVAAVGIAAYALRKRAA